MKINRSIEEANNILPYVLTFNPFVILKLTCGKFATIFKKINIDVPLPIPFIDILSDSHIRNAAPPVINATVEITNVNPGSITILCACNMNEIPAD